MPRRARLHETYGRACVCVHPGLERRDAVRVRAPPFGDLVPKTSAVLPPPEVPPLTGDERSFAARVGTVVSVAPMGLLASTDSICSPHLRPSPRPQNLLLDAILGTLLSLARC